MKKGSEVARGKTKILYESVDRGDAVVVVSQDQITAGDGAKRDVIGGKGRLAALTTARVFRLLNACGIPTHYLGGGEDEDGNEMLVRRCEMIPIEVVVRGVAAGSYVKRNPGVRSGTVLPGRLVEYFFKDDANHDPQYTADQIVVENIATAAELAVMTDVARIAFDVLAHAWKLQDVQLVDLKVEFGRTTDADGRSEILLADVIDNDSWRIWPAGDPSMMLDKQVYRNIAKAEAADLEGIKDKYQEVATRTGRFVRNTGGFVAILMGSASDGAHAQAVADALGKLGVPSRQHVASAHKTPAYALAKIGTTDAVLGRVVYVTIAGRSNALSAFVDAATANPVIASPPVGTNFSGMDVFSSLSLPSGVASMVVLDPGNAALAAAKILAVDDSVIYGRVLMAQYRSRIGVMQSDARISETTSNTSNGKAAQH